MVDVGLAFCDLADAIDGDPLEQFERNYSRDRGGVP